MHLIRCSQRTWRTLLQAPLRQKTCVATMSGMRWILEILLLTIVLATEGKIEVRLRHGGRLKGTRMTTENGLSEFYAFRGIPYAEQPERFKPPVPKQPWGNKLLNATDDGAACLQVVNGAIAGSEDCLFLNVYTPKLPRNGEKRRFKRRAVMVYIHGGYFTKYDGRSVSFPPGRLMNQDIVLVTLNYRLNALGFLATEDAASPGNYGLMDQNLALQWVKENIEAFGGNKSKITVFGQSSGAASVSYQLLSPLSKGLFQQAIAMSGSALCTWAFQGKPLRMAQALSNLIGCPTNSTEEMVACLRAKPAEALLKPIPNTLIPFPPTVDGKFLPSHPLQIMNDGKNVNKVIYMTGVDEMDGVQDVWDLIRGIWETPATGKDLANRVLGYMTNATPQLMQMIINRYFTTVDWSDKREVATTLMRAYSDGAFVMPHYSEAQLLSKAGMTVYTYLYNYHATNIHQKVGERYNITHATSHGEELYMLFDKDWYNNLGKLPLSKEDWKMVKEMTRLWRTFAQTGNPDPKLYYKSEWEPSTPQLLQVQVLNRPSITENNQDLTKNEYYSFWAKDFAEAMRNSNYTSVGK